MNLSQSSTYGVEKSDPKPAAIAAWYTPLACMTRAFFPCSKPEYPFSTSNPNAHPGWVTTSMNCFSLYGIPLFHSGVLKMYASARAKRSKICFISSQTFVCALLKPLPENSAILAPTASPSNSGSLSSNRLNVSSSNCVWLRNSAMKVLAIFRDSLFSPRVEALICSNFMGASIGEREGEKFAVIHRGTQWHWPSAYPCGFVAPIGRSRPLLGLCNFFHVGTPLFFSRIFLSGSPGLPAALAHPWPIPRQRLGHLPLMAGRWRPQGRPGLLLLLLRSQRHQQRAQCLDFGGLEVGDSGGRTGPAPWPTHVAPAFTMATA